MAFHVLASPLSIPCSTDAGFLRAVNARLARHGRVETVTALYSGASDLQITPVELLLHLGLATAAAIPAGRHPAAPLWALLRYVDIFQSDGGRLALDRWVERSERARRRSVLSEDLGIAVCAAVAARAEPDRALLDVDAFDRSHGSGAVWHLGGRRPDYVTAPPLPAPTDRRFSVWEAKGRSWSPGSAQTAQTFFRGVTQACSINPAAGWTVDRRCVVGMSASRRSLSFHALRVTGASDRGQTERPSRRRVRSRPELDTLLRFAGLSPDSGDPDLGQDGFEAFGQDFVGRRMTFRIEEGVVTVNVGVERRVREAVRQYRLQTAERRAQPEEDERQLRGEASRGERVRVSSPDQGIAVAVSINGAALRIAFEG